MTKKLFANISLIVNFIAAVIALLVLFGVDITEQQVAGIMLVVTTFLAILSAVASPSVPVGGSSDTPGP